MTRLDHCLELVGDIRDCAMRARDLGFGTHAVVINQVADQLEHITAQQERPSLPPVLASNQEARAKADEHFKNARKILKGILK